MKCKFCKTDVDKLAKSHIYPKKLIKRITTSYKIYYVKNNEYKPSQSLPYVHDILCQTCDNGIFSEYDNIGYDFFSKLDYETKRIIDEHNKISGEIDVLNFTKDRNNKLILASIDLDNITTKLYFLSILLRQSYSNQNPCDKISIGNYYEELIKKSMSEKNKPQNVYVTLYVTLPTSKSTLVNNINNLVTYATVITGIGKHHYQFRISNLVCNITTGKINDNEMKHAEFIDSQIWNENKILIPIIPTDEKRNCSLIQIDYDQLSKIKFNKKQ